MERLQIYLETEQRVRLGALARARGRPAAELVREAVSRYLEAQEAAPVSNDGLLSLVGAAGELERAADVSTNHHRYLALAEPGRPRYRRKGESESQSSTRPAKRPKRGRTP